MPLDVREGMDARGVCLPLCINQELCTGSAGLYKNQIWVHGSRIIHAAGVIRRPGDGGG